MEGKRLTDSVVPGSFAGCLGGYHVDYHTGYRAGFLGGYRVESHAGCRARCLAGYVMQRTELSFDLLEDRSHTLAGQGHRDEGCSEHGLFLDHHIVHG